VEQGRAVYVHCWGGIGRTGTVIGCLLAHNGNSSDDILATIARLRAGTSKASRPSPESREQVAAIEAWCRGLTD
jgi:protein-tyrosine phosphatase